MISCSIWANTGKVRGGIQCTIYGLNCVPQIGILGPKVPQKVSWFWDRVFTEVKKWKWKLIVRVALNSIWHSNTKGKSGHREGHREKMMWRRGKKMALYPPRRMAWNRPFPHNPQEEPTLMTPSFQTAVPQSCETITFCHFKPPHLWYC